MGRAAAWFLNFDADDELARPSGHTPSQQYLDRWSALRDAVLALMRPVDAVLEEGQISVLDYQYVGIAWCPTPRALRALGTSGAALRPSPSIEVLRTVNSRAFSADLGQTLSGAVYACSVEDVDRALGGSSPTGQWLLKRAYGFAGRGRLRLNPTNAEERERARSWIDASLRSGDGLQVEPWVEREGDFGIHGYVRQSGEVVVGAPTRQECDATGAWVRSDRALESDFEKSEQMALIETGKETGEALFGAGYFGPFGVDAYRYKGPGGRRFWNFRSDINARYSMGWAVGMGALRPDLEDL